MTSPERARRLYIIRHGVTEWNRANRLQGQTDIPLAAEGREQAARLAARMQALARPPQAIWTSDLSRAYETADAIGRLLGLPVRTLPGLRETGFGLWEGRTAEEIQAQGDGDLLTRYRADPLRFRPPGGETLEDVWIRMVEALATVRRESRDADDIAIVGHGGSLRVIVCDALEAPLASMRHMFFGNSSLSVIEESSAGEPVFGRLILFNDTRHLDKGEL